MALGAPPMSLIETAHKLSPKTFYIVKNHRKKITLHTYSVNSFCRLIILKINLARDKMFVKMWVLKNIIVQSFGSDLDVTSQLSRAYIRFTHGNPRPASRARTFLELFSVVI